MRTKEKKPLWARDHFTTGQIADLLGISPRVVCQWVDSKKLRGWLIPGGNDRRVPRTALLTFLKLHGMDVPQLLNCPLVMCLGRNVCFPPLGYEVVTTDSPFELGWRARATHPVLIVIDAAWVGTTVAKTIGRDLNRLGSVCHLVGIRTADDAGDGGAWEAAGYDVILPAEAQDLDSVVADLLRI